MAKHNMDYRIKRRDIFVALLLLILLQKSRLCAALAGIRCFYHKEYKEKKIV
jgi:hypothetical protein